MKTKSLILTVAFFVFLLGACDSIPAPAVADPKFFPEKVGEYSKSFPPQFFSQMHNTKYQKPDAEIYYAFGTFKSDAEAQVKFNSKQTCEFPTLPDGIKADVIKDAVLKDKAGTDIGKLRVCRVKRSQLSGTVGDYQYAVMLSDGKNVVSTSTVINGNLTHLVEFIEALPLEPKIDLGSNLADLMADNSSTAVNAADLMKKDFPVKLAGEPYIKGKYLLVKETPYSRAEEGNNRTVAMFVTASEYRLPPDQVARTFEEAGTVIRVGCTKGAQMADYVAKTELKQKTPAYSVNCKITVVDKSIPEIIAQKDMIGTDLLEEISLSPNDKEIRALEPIEKIRAFITALPRR